MTEKEYKWIIGDKFDIDLFIRGLSGRHGRALTIREPVEKIYKDRYYDTKELTLYLSGFGCRLRVTDRERIEIKFQPKKRNKVFMTRDEWLVYEKDPESGIRFEGKKVKQFFLEEFGYLIPGDLMPVVQMRSVRKKWIIEYKGSEMELSYDISEAIPLLKGADERGNKTYSFRELELESVSEGPGTQDSFSRIGILMGKELGENSYKSKLERALSYFNLNYRKTRDPGIKAEESTSVTAVKIISYYFSIAEKNLPGVEIGIDAEYIHDMRVAIRKLRTALPFFEFTMNAGDFNYLRNNLRWIAQTLGNVRDMDVYRDRIRDFVPAGMMERNREIMESINEAVKRLRDDKRVALINALRSFRFKHFMIRVKTMVGGSFQRKDYRSISAVPAKVTARAILKKNADNSIKYSARLLRDFEAASDGAIHKLRISYKKLRYAIEFFSDFFETGELKILELLHPLQDEVGLYVDTFFLEGLTEEIIERMDGEYSDDSFFMLKGISAAVEKWKNHQKKKIYAAITKLNDSQELPDFLEGVEKLIIR